MSVIFSGVMFGLVCVVAAALTAAPTLSQLLLVYTLAGNLGAILQAYLIWSQSPQEGPVRLH